MIEFIDIENDLGSLLNELQKQLSKKRAVYAEANNRRDIELKKMRKGIAIILCIFFPPYIYILIYQYYKREKEKKINAKKTEKHISETKDVIEKKREINFKKKQ